MHVIYSCLHVSNLAKHKLIIIIIALPPVSVGGAKISGSESVTDQETADLGGQCVSFWVHRIWMWLKVPATYLNDIILCKIKARPNIYIDGGLNIHSCLC